MTVVTRWKLTALYVTDRLVKTYVNLFGLIPFIFVRKVLHEYWSRSKRIFKAQPLDTIERYYGAEVGLYFAWFGFYISMLTISALFGVIFFVIAIFLYPSESVYMYA